MKKIKLEDAVKTLIEHLKEDEELFYGYQSNIAMAFYDAYYNDKKKYKNKEDIHRIANDAAINFLNIFTLDSSKKEKAEEKAEENEEEIKIDHVKTLDDCIEFVVNLQKGNEKEFQNWMSMHEDDAMINAHHGIGQWLRNTLGLWFDGPCVPWFNQIGIYHADDMSSIILISTHRKLNNKDIELKKQVEYYRNYWEEVNPNVNKGIKTMTEHSLYFFLEQKHELKQEYIKRLQSLGIKDMYVELAWNHSGEYEFNILFPGNISESLQKKIKTLLPDVCKEYKVKVIFNNFKS